MLLIFCIFSRSFLCLSLPLCQHVPNTADNSVKAKWILFNVFLSSQLSSSSHPIHRRVRNCVKYHWFYWTSCHCCCCLFLVRVFSLALSLSVFEFAYSELLQMDFKICKNPMAKSGPICWVYDNNGHGQCLSLPIPNRFYYSYIIFLFLYRSFDYFASHYRSLEPSNRPNVRRRRAKKGMFGIT